MQNLTDEYITLAVGRLASLAMFPADPDARVGIMRLIKRMVTTKEQLDWLVLAMIDRVGTWHGPVEFRGVFCSRFKPADGIEANCLKCAGFTALDSEAAYTDEQPKALEGPQARKMIEGLKAN